MFSPKENGGVVSLKAYYLIKNRTTNHTTRPLSS
jgi:hypothetical protein